MPVRRIVAGTDGSDDARRALEWTADLARPLAAEVVVVHALGLLEQLSDERPVSVASRRDEIAREFERSWCAPLDTAGVAARRVIRDGPPVDVLLAVAAEEAADLIVVGSRGVGVTAPLLGSTSHRLAATSRCPVVIVPSAPA